MTPTVPVKSVKKALDLLSLLAFEDLSRQGFSLSALAARMEMPSNTVHNLLKTMVACGYVSQTSSGTYRIGARMTDMGRLNAVLAAVSSPRLKDTLNKLCQKLGEAVTLTTLVDGQRIMLYQVDPRITIRVDAASLESRSLFARPTGRILAAFADPGQRSRILERHGMPGTDWAGMVSETALLAALTQVREAGAVTIAENNSDLVAFAVPVLDENGGLLAALGCYAPAFRCDTSRHAPILSALKQTAFDLVDLI